ncbi:A/G-specific adenine glycosylase [Candidatus Saccharibacteria bacterium]|nr:MAG: A/G-specific adenine glycosylase [Candidatus Saccharibacteria bacterium]
MDKDTRSIAAFVETVWSHYHTHGRHELPWRRPELDGSYDPYNILVSELMLQQTQVARVVVKYQMFLRRFPTIQVLAGSELGDVLRVWQGLGYNRRAKYLWHAARIVVDRGSFPNSAAELMQLPGVGVNTAGAILAYAYNQADVFVETNIRTVYIHHFTRDGEIVSDDFIRDCLGQTLDHEHPREFYWALMDYGAYLKTQVRNLGQSKHYTKQSAFHGSKRQIRGQVLRELSMKPLSAGQLTARIADERLFRVIEDLETEGLIRKAGDRYRL